MLIPQERDPLFQLAFVEKKSEAMYSLDIQFNL